MKLVYNEIKFILIRLIRSYVIKPLKSVSMEEELIIESDEKLFNAPRDPLYIDLLPNKFSNLFSI